MPGYPTGEQIEIAQDDQRAVVVAIGAGLREYTAGGSALVDGYRADEPCTSGRGQVLLPWPNRIEDGRYDFDGKRHQLPINEPALNNAIHGLFRTVPWRIAERDDSRVVMAHSSQPQPGYPYALDLSVEYSLSAEGLTVRTTAVNTGIEPCPFGAGNHPYLTLGTTPVDALRLHCPARTMILSNERSLPVGSGSVGSTDYDFRTPRPIGAMKLDTAYGDLEREADGIARVRLSEADESRSLTVWVDRSYSWLMLFTGDPLPDVNRRSIAVEPMSCPPNAFRSGADLVVLAPGASWTGAWGIQAGV